MSASASRVGAAALAALVAATLAALASPFLTPAAADAAPSPTARAAGSSQAEALVEAYNRRELGSPGWRRIRLELVTDGVVTRTFEVIHAFQSVPGGDPDEGVVRSLVLLEKPEGLRGTNYLLAEGNELTLGLEVFLNLPSGNRSVIAIRPGRFDEGLLGSDFSYADLLWRLPTKGRSLKLLGETAVDGVPAWVVEAEPVTEEARQSTTWRRTRYMIGRDPMLLLAADYYGEADGSALPPEKRLRIEGWQQVDGVWTPTRMVMTVTAGRHSVLTLLETHFDLPAFDPALFAPEALPTLAETMRRGELPAFVAPSR